MENSKQKNTGEIDDKIMTYLKALLEKKGMSGLPSEILADMLMDLYGKFEGYLLANVMEEMDDKTAEKFEAFIQSNPAKKESMKFLKENFANIQDVVKKSMLEFEKIYLEG